MKKLILLTTTLLSLFATSMHAQTNANNNILVQTENAEAAAKTPEAKTEADKWTARLGTGWRDTWRKSTWQQNDAIVDAYVKQTFSVSKGDYSALNSISPLKKQALLKHIAEKEKLTSHDFSVVSVLNKYHAGIAAREDDFVKFLTCGPNIKGEEYYKFLIQKLEVRSGGVTDWTWALRSDEVYVLASANAAFAPSTFAAMRNVIAMKAARLLLEKRKTEKLSISGAEFDAAFAPIIDALKTPKFAGLEAALETVGIDMSIPSNSVWTAQEAVAQQVISAAERDGLFTTAWGVEQQYETGLGSVMFVKGETEYNSWRAQTIAKD